MKQSIALMFCAAVLVTVANAQSVRGLMPRVYAERDARREYAPYDYYFNNGYGYGGYGYGGGYGYYGGRLGTSAIVGAASGAIAGGVVAAVISHRSDNRTAVYAAAPDGGQYYSVPQGREVRFAASKPQKPPKPLDCRKPVGKRGKNEQACAAAEREIEAAKEAAKQEAEVREAERLAKRLYNRTDFPLEICDCGNLVRSLRVNQSVMAPEARCGYTGTMLVPDRETPGRTVRIPTEFRLAQDKSGWVFTAPKEVRP